MSGTIAVDPPSQTPTPQLVHRQEADPIGSESDSSQGVPDPAESDKEEEDTGGGSAEPANPHQRLYLANFLTGSYHAAELVPETSPLRTSKPAQILQLQGRSYRALCGSMLTQPPSLYAIEDGTPVHLSPCGRSACMATLDLWTLPDHIIPYRAQAPTDPGGFGGWGAADASQLDRVLASDSGV